METFCAHLTDVRVPTGVPDMDSATTMWQMNWVTATVAATDTMLNKDGKILAQIDLSDVTGTVRARMPETVALQLSAAADTDAFLRSATDGDPVFPTMLSVKIARTQRTVSMPADSAGADTHNNAYVNYTIIDACPQPKDHVRSKSALELGALLRHLSTMTSAVTPARLSAPVHSKAHPLSIQYNTAQLPCMTAWTIVMTKAKSSCTQQPPFVVTTQDVMDGACEPQNPEKKLSMKILSNEANKAAVSARAKTRQTSLRARACQQSDVHGLVRRDNRTSVGGRIMSPKEGV